MAGRWLIRIRARRALRALDRAGTALTDLWYDLKHSDFRARELSGLLLGADLDDEKDLVRDILFELRRPGDSANAVMGPNHGSVTIDHLEMDKNGIVALTDYLKDHDTGYLAEISEHPMSVEIAGDKAFVFYSRIAEVDTEEFMRLLCVEES